MILRKLTIAAVAVGAIAAATVAPAEARWRGGPVSGLVLPRALLRWAPRPQRRRTTTDTDPATTTRPGRTLIMVGRSTMGRGTAIGIAGITTVTGEPTAAARREEGPDQIRAFCCSLYE